MIAAYRAGPDPSSAEAPQPRAEILRQRGVADPALQIGNLGFREAGHAALARLWTRDARGLLEVLGSGRVLIPAA
jgi:hypothetical protein